MLPVNNHDEDSNSIFLLSGSSAAIDSLVTGKNCSWEDKTRQVRIDLADLYSAGEKEVQESSRLHVVDLAPTISPNSQLLSEEENSGQEVVTELWGKLIAEINYISSLNMVMYDYQGLHNNIISDFENVSVIKQSTPNCLKFGELNLLNVPYIEAYIPEDDATSISKYLCEWPVLVLSATVGPDISAADSSSTGPDSHRKSYLMPLDPIKDVVYLAKSFRAELDKFLKDAHVENHHDFSLFTAYHAMSLVTTNNKPWVPACVRDIHTPVVDTPGAATSSASSAYYDETCSSAEDVVSSFGEILGQQIMTNPFCCYQIIRYVCLYLKSGFSDLIERDAVESIPYYEILFTLEHQLQDMSICRQMGHRLSYCSSKYASLLIYGLAQETPHVISHSNLVRLSQYTRLECDVGTCFPAEPDTLLPIQKLSDFVKNVLERTPVLYSDVPQTELGSAFERLRQIGISCSNDESIWLRFNTDVFFMNSIAHQTMKGEISKKSINNVWDVPKDAPSTTQWIALFASGFAFTLMLPKTLLENLEDGQLLCTDVSKLFRDCDEMECYVIHLDYKELAWQNYLERLKQLYRLKNNWTRLELCAWLDRCLTAGSESIDTLINKCLKSSGPVNENLSLHLEKRSA